MDGAKRRPANSWRCWTELRESQVDHDLVVCPGAPAAHPLPLDANRAILSVANLERGTALAICVLGLGHASEVAEVYSNSVANGGLPVA